MAPKRKKEPQAPARDERTVAVLRPVPAGFRALSARAAGRGIEVAATEEFGSGDGRIAAWVDATRAARAVVALPAGSCVVRAVQLPAAAEDRLASALELNANSFVLGRSPRWRVASSLLPPDPLAEMRTGIVVEWPDGELAPEVPDAPMDGVVPPAVEIASDPAPASALIVLLSCARRIRVPPLVRSAPAPRSARVSSAIRLTVTLPAPAKAT